MWNHIHPKIVLSEFSIEIRNYEDWIFVGKIIERLDFMLQESEDYKSLRDILARGNDDREKQIFFKSLFNTWWIKNFSGSKWVNPISALTLWLTSRKYKLAYELFKWIWKYIPITRETLKQIWKLIQLIESPSLLRLRLDLLDPYKNYYCK